MKKTTLCLLFAILLFASCHKSTLPFSEETTIVHRILQKQLSNQDLREVDFSTFEPSLLRNGNHLYRLKMQNEYILIEASPNFSFLKGAIYSMTGSVSKTNGHATFSGAFHRSDLQHHNVVQWGIEKGMIKELHQFKALTTNGRLLQVNSECSDCTLPEVVVSSSYSSNGIDWFTWMNLLSLFGMGMENDYIIIDFGGGGGGGTSPAGPVVTIDREISENKTPIDLKKFLNCFGSVSDAGATCTITISTDIPMDGHPEQIFDWSQGNPGHAFIELYKAGANGSLISQNFGLYPSIGFLALTGIDIPSKIVDNAGHEYNARYTISVTPAQFQAAINTAGNLGSQGYNIATFNCTDFALAVFNAAGGNLSIPQRQIPGFPNGTTGSNTPQGLYQKLDDMKAAGNSNIDVVGSKAYGGNSHGPCN